MSKVSDKSVVVLCYGLFFSLARRLARDFKKVYYYDNYRESSAKSDDADVGNGYDDVERISDFHTHAQKADLLFFPDIQDSDVQKLYRDKIKIPCYGSGDGEDYELDRMKFIKLLKRLNMPVVEPDIIKGDEDIKKYLMTHKDKWLKGSHFRGDLETRHHIDWDHSRPWFNFYLDATGEHDNEILAFDPIESVCEVGSDWWIIDGKPSPMGIYGYEIKNQAFIGKVEEYDKLPKQLKYVSDRVIPAMKGLGYYGAWSNELRIKKDGTPHFIDFTAREPNPPGSCRSEVFHNYPEIVYDVANGEVPKFDYDKGETYCAELILTLDCKDYEIAVDYPKSIEQWVKLCYVTKSGKQEYVMPVHGIAGTVVGLGSSPEKAMEKAIDHAKQVKGEGLHYSATAMQDCMEAIEKGKGIGIKF